MKIYLPNSNIGLSPEGFTAKTFEENWLQEVQQVVRFWLGTDEHLPVQTSGSTGVPKITFLPKSLLKTSALATLTHIGIQSGSALLAIPAKYIGGKMMVIRAMVAGLDLYLIEPKAALQNVDQQFNLTAFTPLQAANSLALLPKFGAVLIGGGVISASLENELQHCPAKVYHTFGMTETASHVALRTVNGPARSEYFEAMPGIFFSTDNRQCLVIETTTWGFTPLTTNDVVQLHNPTMFTWLGRADNVINSGGVKLFPEVIEKQLEKSVDAPFFVAGLPDEALGQKLVLVVEGAKRTLDFSHLPRLQQPKNVFFLAHFVRTETGKINRPATVALLH